MAAREEALRGYLRSNKAVDLMTTIVMESDGVWAEDELIRDVLANVDRGASREERQ